MTNPIEPSARRDMLIYLKKKKKNAGTAISMHRIAGSWLCEKRGCMVIKIADDASAYIRTLEAQNKLLKDCLKDYVESCEGFGHKPHCCCLPAKEALSLPTL